MKTIKTHRPNGDIYIGRVRVYNGFRQAPVRWVEILLGLVGVPLVWFLIVLLMSLDELI